MNTDEQDVLHATKIAAASIIAFARATMDGPTATLVGEALDEGSGKLFLHVIPHEPFEVWLRLYTDQGGERDLLHLIDDGH